MSFLNKKKDEQADGNSSSPSSPVRQIPSALLWLGDSPMFIDEPQITSFYDAVIRPEYETGEVVLSDSLTRGTEFSGGLTLGSVFPWMKASADVSASRSKSKTNEKQVTLKPVNTAQRQLEHLALYYVDRFSEAPLRVRMITCTLSSTGGVEYLVSPEGPPDWNDPDFIAQAPRALVFIDLPAGVRLIPAALETKSGDVKKLFDKFAEAITPEGETPPVYPGSTPDLQSARDEYWSWFNANFSDGIAMEIVEEAVTAERVEWIDYRVGIGEGKQFLHLHVSGHGAFDTGTFAYQFIKRGFKHGVRLVGTLKSEPDMNVLAIFEK